MKPVYLCGFMGCGKSHIGRMLSKECCAVFIDLDRYIVDKEKMRIPEIFEKYGEPYFRELEAKYIKNFKGRTVVATGGGAIIWDEAALFAGQQGTVIFLDVPFKVCYERIKGDENRPIVVNSTKEQLEELYNKRYPIYKQNSNFTVDAKKSDKEIVADIMAILDSNDRKAKVLC